MPTRSPLAWWFEFSFLQVGTEAPTSLLAVSWSHPELLVGDFVLERGPRRSVSAPSLRSLRFEGFSAPLVHSLTHSVSLSKVLNLNTSPKSRCYLRKLLTGSKDPAGQLWGPLFCLPHLIVLKPPGVKEVALWGGDREPGAKRNRGMVRGPQGMPAMRGVGTPV